MRGALGWLVALALTLGGSSGAFAQQPDPTQDGVQLQMPDRARPRPTTGLVPQLRLGGALDESALDEASADDAIDDALSDDEFLDEEEGWDEDWGDEDWGEGWGEGDDSLAEPDPLDVDALAAEDAHDMSGHEAAHMEADGHGDEHGAEHEGGAHAEHFNLLEFIASVVNFLIWLAIVVFLARKPLAEFLRGRRIAVEEGLTEAKQLQEAAETKYDEYTARLEHLDEELESLRAEMVNAAETERDRIIEEAEQRAARMRKDSQFVIEQQMKQLRTDLTREAIEAAVTAAGKVLDEQVQASDQTRLADDYLESLDAAMKDEEVRA